MLDCLVSLGPWILEGGVVARAVEVSNSGIIVDAGHRFASRWSATDGTGLGKGEIKYLGEVHG